MGLTLLHTIVQGLHAGTTVRYVRGTWRTGGQAGPLQAESLLERGEALTGGSAEQHIDLDIGVLALAGPMRFGGVARNLRAPTFGAGAVSLPRQVRFGAAFDAARAGGPPLLVAIDADLKAYTLPSGARQVVAVGGEEWFVNGRLGVRAGARFCRLPMPVTRICTAFHVDPDGTALAVFVPVQTAPERPSKETEL